MTDDGRKSALRLTFSGVSIHSTPSDHYVDGDWRTIQFAPLWVFESVAASDKKVDEKERAAFVASLASPPTSPLTEYLFGEVGGKLAAIEAERAKDKREPARGLGEVEALLQRYPDVSDADLFRRALVSLGQKVASASGGGLFGLGSKVSDAEAEAIERLRKLFRVTGP